MNEAIQIQKHSQEIKDLGQALKVFPSIIEVMRLAHPETANKLVSAVEPVEETGELMLTVASLLDTVEPMLSSLTQINTRMVCSIGNKEVRSKNKRCIDIGCTNRTDCVKKIVVDIKMLLSALVDHLIFGFTDSNKQFHPGILDSVLLISNQEKIRDDLEPVINALSISLQVINEIEKLLKQDTL
jgi:hypothetical protein